MIIKIYIWVHVITIILYIICACPLKPAVSQSKTLYESLYFTIYYNKVPYTIHISCVLIINVQLINILNIHVVDH